MQIFKALAIVLMSMSPVAAFAVCASETSIHLNKVTAETIRVDGATITLVHSGFMTR